MEAHDLINHEDDRNSMFQVNDDGDSCPHRTDRPTYFITEIVSNDDSDVECEEDIGEDGRYRIPIRRQLEEDFEEEAETEEGREEIRDEEDWEWKEGATKPDFLEFTDYQGLRVKMEEDATPFDYLRLMINEDMMKEIVTETNRYAADRLGQMQLGPHSRFRQWVNVTVNEMWAFFGLIISMGLIVIDELDDYWSEDPIFNLPLFRSVIKRDRFCLILSFLHLCDNRKQLPKHHADHDPIFKVRSFISSLTDNFKRVFKPGKNIAIDEAMVAWRGPIAFRAYHSAKPDKCGIKVFELCDSSTGYCSNLEVFTGKKEAAFNVVHRLITPYLGSGRTLFVDSFYTSPDLFTFLKEEDTLACGAMRLNRKNGPPKAMLPRLSKEDTEPTTLSNGTLNLIRFFDMREVNVLTTAHDDIKVKTGRINPVTKEPVLKLEAVHDYNKNMGAVDRSDQIVSYNAFKRRTLKWWKKVFFHMFMLGILNAFIVHKVSAVKKMSHKIFRRELAKELIQLMPVLPMVSPSSLEVGATPLLRLTARHFPMPIQPKPGRKAKSPQRDCVVCSQPGKRRHSRYECPSCDVGLHIVCFQIYHTCKDYKRAVKRRLEEVE